MGVEVRGNVVFNALQSTANLHLYFLSPPTPATLSWLPEQELFSSIPRSLERQSCLAFQSIPSHQETRVGIKT